MDRRITGNSPGTMLARNRESRRLPLWVFALAGAAAFGCAQADSATPPGTATGDGGMHELGTSGTSGTLGTGATGDGVGGQDGGSGPDTQATGSGTGESGDDTDLLVPSTTLRRLSNVELTNTYRALVGSVPEAVLRLPPDNTEHAFDRVVDGQTLGRAHLEAQWQMARESSQTLRALRRLDELAPACTDAIMPPSGPEIAHTATGAQMSIGPDWSVEIDANNPQRIISRYAPDAYGSYGFETDDAGSYRLELQVDSLLGTFPSVEVFVDGRSVATQSNIAGPTRIAVAIEVTAGASHVVSYQFDGVGAGNVAVAFEQIEIRGPLDDGAETNAAARDGCAAQLISDWAPLAYRRPLSSDQVARLTDGYTRMTRSFGHHAGFDHLLQSVLTSPSFLYLIEVGDADPKHPGRVWLDPWELAARLSFALCEGPPDAQLRQVAASGDLTAPGELEAQARRLLASSCGRASLRRFVRQWLDIEELTGLNKDPVAFPEWSDELRLALAGDVDRFVDAMVWDEAASYAEFLTSRLAWPDPKSAALYGLSGVVDIRRTTLPERRAGLLTSPAVLAMTSAFDQTSPVKRGVMTLERLVCLGLPPPPEDVDIVPPPVDPNATSRERWAMHSDSPTCSGCHRAIDPVGFAFEEFDAIGRHRTSENGLPVDPRGGMPSLGIPADSVDGAAALIGLLAADARTHHCFAVQWLRATLGRLELATDADDLNQLANQSMAGSLAETLISWVRSDSFRTRGQSVR